MKTILPKIIHIDQKGFVKGRNINEANRFIHDIIDYIDLENGEGIIIFLDQQKAFDRIEAKIGMFADDTHLLNKNEKSVENSFKILNIYELPSGERINFDKTKGLLIGRLKGRKPRFKQITRGRVNESILRYVIRHVL